MPNSRCGYTPPMPPPAEPRRDFVRAETVARLELACLLDQKANRSLSHGVSGSNPHERIARLSEADPLPEDRVLAAAGVRWPWNAEPGRPGIV
jgi:hypothetical protein